MNQRIDELGISDASHRDGISAKRLPLEQSATPALQQTPEVIPEISHMGDYRSLSPSSALVYSLAWSTGKASRAARGDYFLAGNTLKWPVIGLAMFAAHISTVHLVSLAEAAYKYGLFFGNFEWMAGFTLILLSLFFAPLYLRAKVALLDLLERRFNRACRDVLSVISLFSAIVIHMGVALYTAAWVFRGILGPAPGATILGMDALLLFIVVLGLLTGIYTMFGGLLAGVWTESVQTVLLLIGEIVITVVGYMKVGDPALDYAKRGIYVNAVLSRRRMDSNGPLAF